MNKNELVAAIAEKSGLTKTDSKKALDGFIAAVTDALKAGEKVALVGFGTFAVAERSARTGVNPATKETIEIPAKKVAKFKAGVELTDAIEG
ncbi:MAG: HU family DNA-binding protein [Bacteroidales bacterium]|nr:HU family DNA-binding protein [Bacteroidales bacterium]